MDDMTLLIRDRIEVDILRETHPEWTISHLAQTLGRSRDFIYSAINRSEHPEHETFSQKYMNASCAPKTNEKWVKDEVKKVIIELRDELSEVYGRPAGAQLIIDELRERQDLRDDGFYLPTSKTTVTDILREAGYILSQPEYVRQPTILPAPMSLWEIDFGEMRLSDGSRFEFFAVIDVGTSRLIYLEGSEGYNAETALEAIARLFLLKGLPDYMRMDRDPRFVGSWKADGFSSALLRFCRVLGVEVDICSARKPWQKGFVERVIKTLKYEIFPKYPMNNLGEARDALEEAFFFYNSKRRHYGRACRGKTPDEAFPNLPTLPHVPEIVKPNAWLDRDHGRVFRRRIDARGFMQVDKKRYYVGKAHAKKRVLVHLDAHRRQFIINDGYEIISTHDIEELFSEDEIDFNSYLIQMRAEARSAEWHRFLMWHRKSDDDLYSAA